MAFRVPSGMRHTEPVLPVEAVTVPVLSNPSSQEPSDRTSDAGPKRGRDSAKGIVCADHRGSPVAGKAESYPLKLTDVGHALGSRSGGEEDVGLIRHTSLA